MPSVDEIPQASKIQTQLAQIQTALAALKAGAQVGGVTVTSSDTSLPTYTPVVFDPALGDPSTIANVTSALELQQTYLINELEQMGYTYNGVATPAVRSVAAPPAEPLEAPLPIPRPVPIPTSPAAPPTTSVGATAPEAPTLSEIPPPEPMPVPEPPSKGEPPLDPA